MRIGTKILVSVVAGAFLLSTGPVLAGTHKTPEAPADYQSKKAPKAKKKALKKGKKYYGKKCKKCHGSKGDGKGSSADDLKIPATAFNAPGYMKGKSDGQLFWITEKGSKGTDMESFGPGSDVNLSEKKIWMIINYMRKEFTN